MNRGNLEWVSLVNPGRPAKSFTWFDERVTKQVGVQLTKTAAMAGVMEEKRVSRTTVIYCDRQDGREQNVDSVQRLTVLTLWWPDWPLARWHDRHGRGGLV